MYECATLHLATKLLLSKSYIYSCTSLISFNQINMLAIEKRVPAPAPTLAPEVTPSTTEGDVINEKLF